jgi:hypothetical protein
MFISLRRCFRASECPERTDFHNRRQAQRCLRTPIFKFSNLQILKFSNPRQRNFQIRANAILQIRARTTFFAKKVAFSFFYSKKVFIFAPKLLIFN